MANRYKVTSSNRYGGSYSKAWEQQREAELMQQEIARQQQAELEAQRKKQENNFVSEIIDISNVGQYVSQGFQQGLAEGDVGKAFSNAGKGLIAGFTPWMDDARFEASQTRKMMEDNGVQIGFSDTYDSWGEAWQGFKDAKNGSATKALRSFANGTLELTWDVATDPLTYVTFGTSALIKGGKKISTEIGEEALKEITERTMKEGIGEIAEKKLTKFTKDKMAQYTTENIPTELAEKQLAKQLKKYESEVLTDLQNKYSKAYRTDADTMAYYMNKLDKAGGTNGKRGINAFGVQLTDGSFMEKIGDATIAPYYHKAMNALSESKIGNLFNHSPGLRKLAHENPELAYKQIRAIDDFINVRQLGLMDNDVMKKQLDEILANYSEKDRIQIMDIIEHGDTLTGKPKKNVRVKGGTALNRQVKADRERIAEEAQKIKGYQKWADALEPLLKGNATDNIMKADSAQKGFIKDWLDPYEQYDTFEEAVSARGGANFLPNTKLIKEKILVNEVLNGVIPEDEVSGRISELFELDEVSARSILRERLGTDAIQEQAFDNITSRADFNTLDNTTLNKLLDEETDRLIMETPLERAKRGQKEIKDKTRLEFQRAYSQERVRFNDELTHDLKTAHRIYADELKELPTITAYQQALDNEVFLKDMLEYKAVALDDIDTGYTRIIKNEEGLFLEKATNWSYKVGDDTIKIKDEMARTALQVKKILSDMGMREMELGLLEKQMKNYAPHYLNPKALDNKKVMEALRSGNPELYQKAINGSGLFNQSDLERGLSKGKTVQQTNEIIKPLLEQAGFDGDLYINNVYDAVMARTRQHNKVMYGGEYGDSMLAQFGIRTKPDMMDSKQKYYISQTDFSKIFRNTDAKTVEAYMGDLKKYNGKTVIQVTADEYKKIAEMYNKNVAHNMGGGIGLNANLPVYELPAYIAHSVQRVGEVAQMKEAHALIKLYDKWTNLFKVGATSSRLGFHVRNLVGNQFNTWLEMGIKTVDKDVQSAKVHMIGYMKKGRKGDILEQIDGTFKTVNGEIPMSEVLQQWELRQGQNRLDDIYGTVQHGTWRDTFKDATMNPLDTQNNAWFRASRQIGDYVETSSRLDVFLATLKDGKTFQEAFETSNKVLFDYADLTDFERNVLRRAIPFYTFASKNLGFMWEELIQNPTRFRMFMNGYMDAIEYDSMFIDEYAQQWMTTGEYTDENGDSIVQKTTVGLPVEQLFNKGSVIDSLSPTLKLIPELIANKKTFNGSSIASQYDSESEQWMDRLDYVAETMFPVMRSAKDALGINDTKDIVNDKELFRDRTDDEAHNAKVKWAMGFNSKDINLSKNERDAIERAIRNIEKEKRDVEKANNPTVKKSKEELQKELLKKYGY